MRVQVFTFTLILHIAGISSKCDYYLGFVYNKPGCNTVDGKNYGAGKYWLEESKCRYCQCYNNAYKCCGIGINDANVTRPIPPAGSRVVIKNCNYHIVPINSTQTKQIPSKWYRSPYAAASAQNKTRRPWWLKEPPPSTTTPAPTTRRPLPPWFEPTEAPDLPDMADLFSMMAYSRGNQASAAFAGKQALPGPSPISRVRVRMRQPMDPWAALFAAELYEPPDGPEVTDPPDYIFTTTPKPTTTTQPPPRPADTLFPSYYRAPFPLSKPTPQGIPPMAPIPQSRPYSSIASPLSAPAPKATSYQIPKVVPRSATPRPISVLTTPRTIPRKPIISMRRPPAPTPTPTAAPTVPQDTSMMDALISLMMMPDFDSEAFIETLQTQMLTKAMRSGFGGTGSGSSGNSGAGGHGFMGSGGGGGGHGFMGSGGGGGGGGFDLFSGTFNGDFLSGNGGPFGGNGMSNMFFPGLEL